MLEIVKRLRNGGGLVSRKDAKRPRRTVGGLCFSLAPLGRPSQPLPAVRINEPNTADSRQGILVESGQNERDIAEIVGMGVSEVRPRGVIEHHRARKPSGSPLSKQTPSRGLIDRERRLVSRRAASDDDGERLWLHRRSILEDSKNLIRQFYELSHRRLVRWLGNKANRHSFTSTAPMTGG